jgi:hypothetical protein
MACGYENPALLGSLCKQFILQNIIAPKKSFSRKNNHSAFF